MRSNQLSYPAILFDPAKQKAFFLRGKLKLPVSTAKTLPASATSCIKTYKI